MPSSKTDIRPPPLAGIRVLEFAGLAPAPFAGMFLADFGASVLRIDRPGQSTSPTEDMFARHKASICVDLKSTSGKKLIKSLLAHVDVVLDPFRPDVLERLDLGPESVMLAHNPELIIGRLTGFRRDGKYSDMAGHDINYLAVSGALDLFGSGPQSKPVPPGNILGDFAGGGLMCVAGILMALIDRQTVRKSGKSIGSGQVVEANMVDGSAYLVSMARMARSSPLWNQIRGRNLLDGGSPFYQTYKTKDDKFFAVGALEPRFFNEFLRILGISSESTSEIEQNAISNRHDRSNWPILYNLFTKSFLNRSKSEWEHLFDGTDSCVTPVHSHDDLFNQGFDQRPPVTLKCSPGLAVESRIRANGSARSDDRIRGQGDGVTGSGWESNSIPVGHGGKARLAEWVGWADGVDYRQQQDGSLVLIDKSAARL